MNRMQPPCQTCIHKVWVKDKNPCVAFPDGIPDPIWDGENDHKKPYPGDNGIIYKKGNN